MLVDVPANALLAGLIRYETESEAIAMANDASADLVAYVCTNDLRRAVRVSEKLKYGIVGLNAGMISTVVAPFGNVKEFGCGRAGSHYGMDKFVGYKLVVSDVGAGI
jgi:succinate-semialdehyde dehydrogenase/glutarate-semialdehyde dehydrogenase